MRNWDTRDAESGKKNKTALHKVVIQNSFMSINDDDGTFRKEGSCDAVKLSVSSKSSQTFRFAKLYNRRRSEKHHEHTLCFHNTKMREWMRKFPEWIY